MDEFKFLVNMVFPHYPQSDMEYTISDPSDYWLASYPMVKDKEFKKLTYEFESVIVTITKL